MKTQYEIRARRSATRRYLAIALAGLLAASSLQDADAQMCPGGGMGGGGRMGGGMGGRGGGPGGGQAGGGAAGMMQMLQMAQQAQQARAMQQQSLLAAMRQQQMRMQQLTGQQQRIQLASTDVTRSGRTFSEARRNRFRHSRRANRTRQARRPQAATETTDSAMTGEVQAFSTEALQGRVSATRRRSAEPVPRARR